MTQYIARNVCLGVQIDQARRIISGGLLVEGCPEDDLDPTGVLYCGVYHPLPAGDPAAPGAVASSSTGIQIDDGTREYVPQQ